MAKAVLPVNFQDDILNASMNGKRRYNLIQNPDGTVSLEDVTTYDQVGSNFGGGQINQTNTAVNASVDAGKIIKSLDTIRATTVAGYIPDALSVKELDNNLKGFQPILDSTGKITGYKTAVGGADTVFPFNGESQFAHMITTSREGSKSITLKNVKHGYIALSIEQGSTRISFSCSNNVTLSTLNTYSGSFANGYTTSLNVYEFNVSDNADITFGLNVSAALYQSCAMAVIFCDK